jgi:hypothetical protein
LAWVAQLRSQAAWLRDDGSGWHGRSFKASLNHNQGHKDTGTPFPARSPSDRQAKPPCHPFNDGGLLWLLRIEAADSSTKSHTSRRRLPRRRRATRPKFKMVEKARKGWQSNFSFLQGLGFEHGSICFVSEASALRRSAPCACLPQVTRDSRSRARPVRRQQPSIGVGVRVGGGSLSAQSNVKSQASCGFAEPASIESASLFSIATLPAIWWRHHGSLRRDSPLAPSEMHEIWKPKGISTEPSLSNKDFVQARQVNRSHAHALRGR